MLLRHYLRIATYNLRMYKICTVTISSSAIATILDRNQDYLQTQYLTPLLRTEKLKHFRQ